MSDPVGDPAAGATRVFLDTNVLVDCADRHDLDRQRLCRAHLLALQESGRAVISTQVLQEFYVVSASSAGCSLLLTGDLNAGQTIRGPRIADPGESGSF